VQPVNDKLDGLWVVSDSTLMRVMSSQVTELELLPAKFQPGALAVDTRGVLWLIGSRDGARNEVMIRSGRGNYESVALLERFLPLGLSAEGEIVSVAGVSTKEVPPALVFFYSKDKGRTWSQEKPAVQRSTGPVFFETPQLVWAYGSMGRIQRRRP
jgi:hypothetical protein